MQNIFDRQDMMQKFLKKRDNFDNLVQSSEILCALSSSTFELGTKSGAEWNDTSR